MLLGWENRGLKRSVMGQRVLAFLQTKRKLIIMKWEWPTFSTGRSQWHQLSWTFFMSHCYQTLQFLSSLPSSAYWLSHWSQSQTARATPSTIALWEKGQTFPDSCPYRWPTYLLGQSWNSCPPCNQCWVPGRKPMWEYAHVNCHVKNGRSTHKEKEAVEFGRCKRGSNIF